MLNKFSNSLISPEFHSGVLRITPHKLCPTSRSSQGSLILASILDNTGYVGLAIVPALVLMSGMPTAFASVILAEEYTSIAS